MRIITWNCQGAFRKKASIILKKQPDILVVQECEHPDKLIFNDNVQKPNQILWFGDNRNKGLGIFSYSNYTFQVNEQYNERIKIIAPIAVSNGVNNFILFAVWANNRFDLDGQYIEQVWKAVHHYNELIVSHDSILIGDFNSNIIWDKTHRIGNHSDVVSKLEDANIYSVYHRFNDQDQGKESHPTFYLQRKQLKPYHIDYCFTSINLYNKVVDIEIGTFEDWINHSDHTPLIVDIDI